MWGRINNRKQSHEQSGSTTLISKATRMHGEVAFEGVMHIEGQVQGNIRADKGLLTLTQSGWVEGDLCVPHIKINGTVRGNVYCSEYLELAEKAVITGSVYYNMIEIAKGAEVNGSLEHHGNIAESVAQAVNAESKQPPPETNGQESPLHS